MHVRATNQGLLQNSFWSLQQNCNKKVELQNKRESWIMHDIRRFFPPFSEIANGVFFAQKLMHYNKTYNSVLSRPIKAECSNTNNINELRRSLFLVFSSFPWETDDSF